MKRLIKLTQDGQLSSLQKELSLVDKELVNKKHVGRSGDTLLHYAARHGHLDIMQFLIKQMGMDVELCNNDYKRPLHEAASMGHHECVSYLISEGANIDSLKKADW